ncbi:MAG: hypothetical protein WCP95_11885 [Actinomycetes bacterium]
MKRLHQLAATGLCAALLATATPAVAQAADTSGPGPATVPASVSAPAPNPFTGGTAKWWSFERARHLKPGKLHHFMRPADGRRH